jgi:thiol-disulfide isomerase/thioredoxin
MKYLWLAIALAVPLLMLAQDMSQLEQESLQRALGEAGNSPVDFMRAIEQHLKSFPNTVRRAELERAVVKTAIDLNDDRRIIQFGESVLQREPDNLQVLERVATALLHNGDKASAERALEHARHDAQVIQNMYKDDKFTPGSGRESAKRKDDYDRAQARSRLLEARAQGLLGHTEEAIRTSEASYAAYPNVEAAREAARWLAAAGKSQEAIQYLAYAFTIGGFKSTDPDSVSDRDKMAELYRKQNGSEAGLGDLVLKAYDNTSNLFAARRTQLRELDPNSQVKDPMRFTVSGVDGEKLKLSSLVGKVVVLDFWATWCGPCRQQHPLYEEVKARFKDSPDLVFLAINTDEDRTLVKPFLDEQRWSQKVYFEDGLSNLLQVSSIPTTIIFGKKGEVVSRMPGFLPDRFVDMLSERIDEALGKPVQLPKTKGAISQ